MDTTISSKMCAVWMLRLALMAALLSLGGCVWGVRTFSPTGQQDIHRERLTSPSQGEKSVELVWAHPPGKGPWPIVLYIHGHQIGERRGANEVIAFGHMRQLIAQGYAVAAVSQPGYGQSDGPPDYCGPRTQAAVKQALTFLRRQPEIKPDRIALYGISRGATVAAMVAAQDAGIAATVLSSGIYDFARYYPSGTGLDQNIRVETGATADAFQARSAIMYAQNIHSPVLLMAGAKDPVIPVTQTLAFADALRLAQVPVTLRVFADAEHVVPLREQYNTLLPFLAANLR